MKDDPLLSLRLRVSLSCCISAVSGFGLERHSALLSCMHCVCLLYTLTISSKAFSHFLDETHYTWHCLNAPVPAAMFNSLAVSSIMYSIHFTVYTCASTSLYFRLWWGLDSLLSYKWKHRWKYSFITEEATVQCSLGECVSVLESCAILLVFPFF